MSRTRILLLTSLAMLAFAGNSLLCRLALKQTAIDAASFTGIRIVSGAVVLWIIVRLRSPRAPSPSTGEGWGEGGSWVSALALFGYAAAFSFAYVSLPAGTGALLLFGAVQATMIGYGLSQGERFRGLQIAGFAAAIAGLVGLLLPGLSRPPVLASALMLSAGVAWGVYSLRGRQTKDATATTGDNFLRAVPLAILLSVAAFRWVSWDFTGAVYAVASGAIASGVGYAIWYTALKGLTSTEAATVQLSVPVIAAVGGIVLLGEPPTLRLLLASLAILGGIAAVIAGRASGNVRLASQVSLNKENK